MNATPQGEFRPLPNTNETDHERAVRRVADAVHRANEAILRAVDAGVSVELIRVSRYHDGRGNWGDQIVPTIREAKAEG
jgi:hypothetical protein